MVSEKMSLLEKYLHDISSVWLSTLETGGTWHMQWRIHWWDRIAHGIKENSKTDLEVNQSLCRFQVKETDICLQDVIRGINPSCFRSSFHSAQDSNLVNIISNLCSCFWSGKDNFFQAIYYSKNWIGCQRTIGVPCL
jgi:hypothetical protein